MVVFLLVFGMRCKNTLNVNSVFLQPCFLGTVLSVWRCLCMFLMTAHGRKARKTYYFNSVLTVKLKIIHTLVHRCYVFIQEERMLLVNLLGFLENCSNNKLNLAALFDQNQIRMSTWFAKKKSQFSPITQTDSKFLRWYVVNWIESMLTLKVVPVWGKKSDLFTS